jgi:hypothetical protein
MPNKHCPPGLDDRCRDDDGEIRRKNGSTHVGTLRDIYGPDFAPGRRTDMHLNNFLDDIGSPSLSEYLKNRNRYDR